MSDTEVQTRLLLRVWDELASLSAMMVQAQTRRPVVVRLELVDEPLAQELLRRGLRFSTALKRVELDDRLT